MWLANYAHAQHYSVSVRFLVRSEFASLKFGAEPLSVVGHRIGSGARRLRTLVAAVRVSQRGPALKKAPRARTDDGVRRVLYH